ncbi:hypothetical protein GCM10011313_21090 [Mycetocola zhadangensis]|nr:hypothetical protein GCM10011313_21090 [Mycetocola zhadangensis]
MFPRVADAHVPVTASEGIVDPATQAAEFATRQIVSGSCAAMGAVEEMLAVAKPATLPVLEIEKGPVTV